MLLSRQFTEDTGVPEADKEFIEINSQETLHLSDDDLDAIRCTFKPG